MKTSISILLIFTFAITSSYAIKCNYGWIQTIGNTKTKALQDLTCSNLPYCYKSYTYTGNSIYATYSCGDQNSCPGKGCFSTASGGYCCCTGNYCNSSQTAKYWVVAISTAFYVFV